MALVLSLLGGESSGKSTLANALHQSLSGSLGLRCSLVGEHLRQWCQDHGRAPHADEQAALAEEQARLIRLAASDPLTDIVIADTSALTIAVYSELYFNDHSLYPAAIAHQRGYALNLLMGLDLPWVPDGLFRDSPAVREASDAALRRSLLGAGLPFHCVPGTVDQRLQLVLRLAGPLLGRPLTANEITLVTGRVPWSCEKCSDPDCEHRLFSSLLSTPSDR